MNYLLYIFEKMVVIQQEVWISMSMGKIKSGVLVRPGYQFWMNIPGMFWGRTTSWEMRPYTLAISFLLEVLSGQESHLVYSQLYAQNITKQWLKGALVPSWISISSQQDTLNSKRKNKSMIFCIRQDTCRKENPTQKMQKTLMKGILPEIWAEWREIIRHDEIPRVQQQRKPLVPIHLKSKGRKWQHWRPMAVGALEWRLSLGRGTATTQTGKGWWRNAGLSTTPSSNYC